MQANSPIISPAEALSLPPLALKRPLLAIGHGTKDAAGRQSFIDFVAAYQALDTSRPVVPCFLELTAPSIQEGIDECVAKGFSEISALPILLFAARHNKFDITNELDRAKIRHPHLKFYYGRHFGIAPAILDLWRSRLSQLEQPEFNPRQIAPADTLLLFVGRGSSDPDANGDACKLARVLWEGSNYLTVETCFIGITHPRLEEGFRRALLFRPKRVIVLPYFLFTGVLVKKIFDLTAQQQEMHPEIEFTCLPEMGMAAPLFSVLRDREIETQLGQVQMNCEMCKFRLSATSHHHHEHHHHHDHHHHHHSHSAADPYAKLEDYHQKIWHAP